MIKNPHVYVIAGPTASGKSDFAVELALQIDGEIISCDSRQLYKRLNIGTGKITQGEMKGVPHHMLDVYDIEKSEDVSVTTFQNLALPILEDCITRGKVPIICGGTGQYIDALIYSQNLPHVVPNKILRQELEQLTTSELLERLQKKDTHRAETIDIHNRVRLIRAIEIAENLGYVPPLHESKLRYVTTMYIMQVDRTTLKKRIDIRLEKRLNIGMLDEGKEVYDLQLTEKQVRRLGIEYALMNDYFDKKITLDGLRERLSIECMQYAKRQQTWLKKYEKDKNLILEYVEIPKV